jgi:ElaB/YqjD/DUF883 family membrane-anchored ribosome-binding protein
MSFLGSIAGGIGSAIASGSAASAEEQGAQQAQALSQQNQTAANQAQQTALSNVTQAEQPYQTLGQTSANGLQQLLGQGFTAPTLAQAEQTPGYQFQLQQGTNAIDANAAANGTLMSGSTGEQLEQFGQGLASTNYQQAYNNALNSYMANVQSLQGGAGLGLSSTGQLGQANLQTAGNTANIDLTAAQQQMQQLNNAAAARAQGILGTAAGVGEAIGGIGSAFSPGGYLPSFGGGGGGSSSFDDSDWP